MSAMKSNNDNLEKNISRLVKLTVDSDTPSEAFTNSVVEGALAELDEAGADRARGTRKKTMKTKWMKITVWAASILIVCGAVIALMFPRLNRVRQYAFKAPALDTQLPRDNSDSDRGPAVPRTVVPPDTGQPVGAAATTEPQSHTRSKPAGAQAKDVETLVANWKQKDSVLAANTPRGGSVGEMAAIDPSAEPGAGRPGMAHGGTTPPNGEDVDAMFFKNYGVNPFVDTEDDHLSTFATDVDTGSYTVARGYLLDGHMPPEEAIRVEEFVNYFEYDYPAPQEDVFAVYAEAAPWTFGEGRKNSHLLRLGLKAMQIREEDRKPAVLTFVIDISGSMNRENRLGLVKRSLRLLIDRLRPEDRIGIAVYGSRGRKVMDHRSLGEKSEIVGAIESLRSGGSTFAEEGIRIGYEMAEQAFRDGHINRVIICSDGVANVGRTGAEEILKMIKSKADKGITLSTIGFGMGNYNDVLMERLGDKGNGYYAYVDTIAEARKLFCENLTGALQVVARDVKVQVDFNPEVVRSYRLIGYENRDVPDAKFRDDTYDGGEMGAGHSTTALYELKLWPGKEGPIATTYVRYKDADTFEATEFNSTFRTGQVVDGFANASREFRLAARVAEFAEILRKSYWARGAGLDETLEAVGQLAGEFGANPDVIELVGLISNARGLSRQEGPEASEDGTTDDM